MDARNLILCVIAALGAGALGVLSLLSEGPRATEGQALAPAGPPREIAREASGIAGRVPVSPLTSGELPRDAADGHALLESVAERALTAACPEDERIEALRAVWKARSPRAAELLATAVRTLPDASRPESVSVPRFALACLLRESGRDESARRGLASVAWEEGAPAELRGLAAAGLAAVAGRNEARQIVLRLRTEREARVREAALAALRENPAATGALAGWSGPVAAVAPVENE